MNQAQKSPARISNQPPSPLRVARFIAVVFCLVGGIGTYFMLVEPTRQILGARAWPEIPCRIVASGVVGHSDGDEGDTYNVDIRYAYTVEGRPYETDRYSFFSGSTSGRGSKQEVVNRYSPESAATCFVDPADPTSAVLQRGFSSEMWFGGIPLLFLLIGLAILFAAAWGAGLVAGQAHPGFSAPNFEPPASAPQRLGSPGTRSGGLRRTALSALFLCGASSIPVTLAVRSWLSSSPDYVLIIMATLVALFSLGLLLTVPYQLMLRANPRVELSVTPEVAPLGGQFSLRWRLDGRSESVRRFSILVLGYEEATAQRGESSSTKRRIFHREVIVETTDAQAMRDGSGRFRIPVDSMHTFRSAHNKVLWTIRVKGEIPFWPDVAKDYPLTVQPRAS